MPEYDDALTVRQLFQSLDKAHEVTKRLALESLLVSDMTMDGRPVPLRLFATGGLWGAAGKEDPVSTDRLLLLEAQPPSRDDWVPNWVLAYALLLALELASDAVRRLSPELRQQHSEVPWSEIMGLRDLIHSDSLVGVWGFAYHHLDAVAASLFPIYSDLTSR